MSALTVHKPMEGCRVVTSNDCSILFGQPPEVVKALMHAHLPKLDTLVLPDIRERRGVLLNNLEFPFYYFLFVAKGLSEGRLLKLVGHEPDMRQALTLLRLTLLGETRQAMDKWEIADDIKQDLYNASTYFALKTDNGAVRDIETFFTLHPFLNDVADLGDVTVIRTATDCFTVTHGAETVSVDLNDPGEIKPPYHVHFDLTPNELVKLGLEVLGGASGFSPYEASTGMVLCFNGNHMLIDSVPFLDQHLFARGISKNQISSLFLTHIHDDHCSMFPLMRMRRKVDVITTREIYGMAMQKLSLGLGWSEDTIREHFTLVPITPGKTLDYYGLRLDAHYTVHSIPTIGATFWTTHGGTIHRLCVVGDNQSFAEITKMRQQHLVHQEVVDTLQRLYHDPCDLLIPDGGMGQLHGDPVDALASQAERVIFVHMDALPEAFNATFSLAGAGKRYTIVRGDCDFYMTRCIEFLMSSFHTQPSTRWISTLLADMRIRQYNKDDVIIKQGDATKNVVYMVLTGYCGVLVHDGKHLTKVASREAGDFIGEMAAVTGEGLRNASVVAETPVTLCEFSEATFTAFIEEEGLRDEMLSIWSFRRLVHQVPQFQHLGSTVSDMLSYHGELMAAAKGKVLNLAKPGDSWAILVAGALRCENSGQVLQHNGAEVGGYRPFASPGPTKVRCNTETLILHFAAEDIHKLLGEVPRFNYELRKYRYLEEHGLSVVNRAPAEV